MIENKARAVKIIVTDVDGVLTDGSVFVDKDGHEAFGKFSIYDGFGIVMAQACGIKIVVISGRQSACTEKRCRNLGISEVYSGVENKLEKLEEVAGRLGVSYAEMAYIGDDLLDLQVMHAVGLAVAPKNAVQTVKDYVCYVTEAEGGRGALRELIDLVLKSQGHYTKYVKQLLN